MNLRASLFLACACVAAQAATIMPVSYSMRNGYSGTYNYWDDSYNGSGNKTVNGALLTGGLGDLTDGTAASDNWFVAEAPAGPGPWVGWSINPIITFSFNGVQDFSAVRIHFDDADGRGGVSAPAGVTINGTRFVVANPVGSAPFWAEFMIGGLSGSALNITLERRTNWVFASEFEFHDTTTVIPEPSTFAMLGGALLAGVVVARRLRA
jgi:hypothetical protein